MVSHTPVSSYLAFPPLPCGRRMAVRAWRYISVALSLRSPSAAVSRYPALWSSDFPQAAGAARGRPACSREPVYHKIFPTARPAGRARSQSLYTRAVGFPLLARFLYHSDGAPFGLAVPAPSCYVARWKRKAYGFGSRTRKVWHVTNPAIPVQVRKSREKTGGGPGGPNSPDYWREMRRAGGASSGRALGSVRVSSPSR